MISVKKKMDYNQKNVPCRSSIHRWKSRIDIKYICCKLSEKLITQSSYHFIRTPYFRLLNPDWHYCVTLSHVTDLQLWDNTVILLYSLTRVFDCCLKTYVNIVGVATCKPSQMLEGLYTPIHICNCIKSTWF